VPDWDAITRGWVDEGLLDEAQREPILARLRATPPDAGGLPIGPIVTLLVAGAVWLLTGAVVTLLLLVQLDEEELVGGVVSVCGVLALVLGGVMRAAPKLVPLARGFLAASPPLVTVGAVANLSDTPVSALVVVPGLVGVAVALLDGSRSTAATASLSLTAGALAAIDAVRDEGLWATLVLLPSLVAVAGAGFAARLVPARAAALEVLAPAGVLFLACDLAFTDVHFAPLWRLVLPNGHPFTLEKGLEGLLVGVVLVAAGALARSGWTLVPALALVAASTIAIATVFGSWIGGTVALALLGGAFLAGASVLWVLRAGDRRA
jgi:hypothetical protein